VPIESTSGVTSYRVTWLRGSGTTSSMCAAWLVADCVIVMFGYKLLLLSCVFRSSFRKASPDQFPRSKGLLNEGIEGDTVVKEETRRIGWVLQTICTYSDTSLRCGRWLPQTQTLAAMHGAAADDKDAQ
jgi:hypothetical protein